MSLEVARKVLRAELEAIEGLLQRLDPRFEQKRPVILTRTGKNLSPEMLHFVQHDNRRQHLRGLRAGQYES